TCDGTGTWQTTTVCTSACSGAGTCTGSCVPGSKQCSGTSVQTCDTSGAWQTTSTCPYLCSGAGVCSGSCVPGNLDCSGVVSRLCDITGTWQTKTTCPFVCSGAGVCSGSCVPITKRCSSTDSQTCDTTGTWQTTSACPYVCSGAGACTGSCVPGAQRCDPTLPAVQTCDLTGAWHDTSACAYVCSASACAGVCTPGKTRCGTGASTDLCGPDGQWQSDIACPTPASGLNEVATCSGGVCGTSCTSTSTDVYADCNGLAPDGCEADLTTNIHHCGVCSRDCLSGDCVGAVCEPTYISAGPIGGESQPLYFAVDSTTLYWSDGYGAGSVRSADLSTFALSTIAPSQPAANWIRERSGSIYWNTEATISGTEYGSINAYAVTTAKETNVVSTQKGLGTAYAPFAVNSTEALWVVGGVGGYDDLWSVALPTGTPKLVKSSIYPTSTLEVDDNYVYATESVPGNVVRYSTGTGARSLLASGQSFPFRVALTSGALYWTDMGAGLPASPGTVMALNLTTGSPTPLATNLNYPKEIGSDGTSVYYSEQGGPTCPNIGFWRVPVGGGAPFLLGCATSLTTNIAVGGQYIYYSDGATIYALAK
ncbi:MAG: hypothetical protein ACHREM_05310, partial [Polyangiales bacterium]